MNSAENSTRPLVDQAVEFMQTKLYENYRECLRQEREEILLVGKKTRDPHILSKLDGFDQAASFFQRQKDFVISQNRQTVEDNDEPDY